MHFFRRVYNVFLCVSLFFTPIHGSVYASVSNKKVVHKKAAGKILYVINIKALENIVKKFNNPQISNDECIRIVHEMKRYLESVSKKKENINEYFEKVLDKIYKESGEKLSKEEKSFLKTKFNNPHIFKGKKSESSIEDHRLPETLVYSISVCLVGLFLAALPVPPIQEWGANLVIGAVVTSGGIIAQYKYDRRMEKEQERKDRKKQEKRSKYNKKNLWNKSKRNE